MKKFFVALLMCLVLITAGCSSYDVENDQTAVEVDGAALAGKPDKKLVDCHEAGTAGYGGSGNDNYYYPAGQRTYSFTGKEGADSEAFPVVSSDNQTISQPGVTKFTLTATCEDLFDFHKKVGLKYKAYEGGGGWDKFLADYLAVAHSNALNNAVGQYPWLSYYQDSATRTKLQDELVDDIQSSVNQSLGSDKWLKINSITLSKPGIPEALQGGLEAVQAAQLAAKAQEEQNAVNRKKYGSLADCVNGFTDAEGVRYAGIDAETCRVIFLAENGDIPFYPIPTGGSVVVNNGQATTEK